MLRLRIRGTPESGRSTPSAQISSSRVGSSSKNNAIKLGSALKRASAWVSKRLRRAPAHPTPTNDHNVVANLPVELLHVIFLLLADPGFTSNSVFEAIQGRPNWISITYVCQRWRVVALDCQTLWSTITPSLSPKWMSVLFERSSHAPARVSLRVGPSNPAPRKRRLLGKRRRRVTNSSTLSDEALGTMFSGTSHARNLHTLQLSGNTRDMVRALGVFKKPAPLVSLCFETWDGYDYDFDEGWEDIAWFAPSFDLPEDFLGGSAPKLRHLHCSSSLHINFPSWMTGSISELTLSKHVRPDRLFTTLRQMPQLEKLELSSTDRYSYPIAPPALPVNLDNLKLFVLENSCLELASALLSCLVLPPSARRHFKLDLGSYTYEDDVWERLTTVLQATSSGISHPPHGARFRREPGLVAMDVWSKSSSGHGPPPWPPQDEQFSLQVRSEDNSCLYCLHTTYSESNFHRLQELCSAIGGSTVEELFAEYGIGENSTRRPAIPYRCWNTLFSELRNVKTLHFGDGAAELLIGASGGALSSLTEKLCDFPNLQKVTVDKGSFSTRTLWNWIHLVHVPPAGMELSEVRELVLTLLSEMHWKPTEIDFAEDVTGSLLKFLLYWKSRGVVVYDVSLVRADWDEPEGVELLQMLLHMLDPDWDATIFDVN
ncbi:hypothetical protein BC834DRAFT_157294 [Gloeopeniophorella convolvens]|nr:hypothetical protein BC834DRAFT_157294 [Gloeopeniophorella convolvens]